MTTDLSPWYEARRYMVEALTADLMGSPSNDVIHEDPLEAFIVGVLHPAADHADLDAEAPADLEDATESDNVGSADPGIALARRKRPSSMGLTFAVTSSTTQLLVEIDAARYVAQDAEAAPPSEAPDRTLHRRGGHDSRPWAREAIHESVTIDITGGVQSILVAPGLELRVVTRPLRHDSRSMTLALVNSTPTSGTDRNAGECWFQPQLAVSTEGGRFADRRPHNGRHLDDDEKSSDLLYRDQQNLATGHACSVTWAEGPSVARLTTTFFPEHDLPLAKADRADLPTLAMPTLGANDDRTLLHELVDSYEQWVNSLGTREVDGDDHAETAARHVVEARRAIDRMRAGIALLDSDPDAARAFRIMNLAMQTQRSRQDMIRTGEQVPSDKSHSWRPFQLAFILVNLVGTADADSPERKLADLLWFPTGGGKTEAYLGLIAFTILLRRLRGLPGEGGGVAVIMRYTLRLLTIQQTERAAGLICALEEWRRHNLPSSAPISIGVWLGQGATPNNVSDAATALRRTDNAEDAGEGDPRIILRCPWCGTDLPSKAYDADKRKDKLTISCVGPTCEFRDGLPVHVVDTDVYRERPSLVVATVDKFAMMTWNADAGKLFSTDGTYAPPDLIVQDELHLISGPLGSLVGLYETVVEHLATGAAGPKLVASTATIRRASEQVLAVFDRETRQFPPPGIDAGDSYFAVDASPEEKGTRKYVGVMAPGTSHATLLIRTYAALLQAGATMEAAPEVRDAYWTLLGYFNSLRVLGAAYIQAIDDVPDRIGVVANSLGTAPRTIAVPREMTSRKKSSEIPQELRFLGTSYPSDDSPAVVLATNMISVGVDVDRLGLMAVMGQPQTTAEYIQATSRVGRQVPGLVVTMFNAARSRDLSHFESFTSYHRALYKHVEATGATPFAPRAIDRGLHGVLVALARHTIDGSSADTSAAVPVDSGKLDDVVDVILRRVGNVSPEARRDVQQALDDLIDAWTAGVETNDVRKYAGWFGAEHALCVPADGKNRGGDSDDAFPVRDAPWQTLTSLRNVDRESKLYLASNPRRNRGDD